MKTFEQKAHSNRKSRERRKNRQLMSIIDHLSDHFKKSQVSDLQPRLETLGVLRLCVSEGISMERLKDVTSKFQQGAQ